MLSRVSQLLVPSLAFVFIAQGCGKSKKHAHNNVSHEEVPTVPQELGPLGQDVPKSESSQANPTKTEPVVLKPSVPFVERNEGNVTPAHVNVVGDVTLPLEALQGKELLYGSDLQFTSQGDGGFADGYQTISLGHKIAKLKLVGNRVVITSDESIYVESGFPRPEMLAEFEIVERSEAEGTVTLRAVNFAQTSMKLWGESIDAAHKPWVRSIEFVKEGSYLLMEVSAYDSKGNVYHFMESLFPRDSLNKDVLPVSPDSADETFAELLMRIGTFPNVAWVPQAAMSADDLSSVTKVQQTTLSRFNIEKGRTIDWYVTRNLPDTLLPDIKAGIEGWNRYFNDFRKDKPVMVFKGKLPENVKIGDPRFNIVNFDAVADAAAAYESQSSDPLTGVQSHSLIYMPLAWYNFGVSGHLASGEDVTAESETSTASVHLLSASSNAFSSNPMASRVAAERHQKIESLKKKNVLRCHRNVETELSFGDAQTKIDSSEEAGRALMRSTLLHEVGHALGMDHNFKASLSGEVARRPTSEWAYSYSVMDYNAPTIEDAQIFNDSQTGSARDPLKGAVLAYDRQFIDILYNGGKQILNEPQNFPILPFCNDENADDFNLGVDPLCVRYDFFGNTLESLEVSRARVESEDAYLPKQQGGFITLAGYMESVKKDTAPISDLGTARAALNSFATDSLNAAKYFLDVSRTSYRRALLINLSLIGEWKSLPETTIESFEAQHSGLNLLARSVPELVNEDGTLNPMGYVAYQNKVTQTLLRGVGSALNSGIREGTLELSGPFEVALKKVSTGVTAYANSLSEKLVHQADKEALARSLNSILAKQQSSFYAMVLKFQLSIPELLPSGGTSLGDDSVASSRGVVSSPVAQQLFEHALALAERSEGETAAREGAIAMLKNIHQRKQIWDGAETKAARAQKLTVLKSKLEKEQQELDKKYKTTGYLTQDEKVEFEALTGMAAELQQMVEDNT